MPQLQAAFQHLHAPQVNAVLAQTMHLLLQPVDTLEEELRNALNSNPALEVVQPKRCPRCGAPLMDGVCPRCSAPKTANPSEPIVFPSPRSDHARPLPWQDEDSPDPEETLLAQPVDLATYVGRQIAPELRDDAQKRIAAYLLANLNDDGLLEISPLEAAFALRVPPDAVEEVLRIIQTADPIGVGSPDPQSALLAQARHLAETRPVPKAVIPLLSHSEGLKLLADGHIAQAAALLGVSKEEIEAAKDFIARNLNPYPARAAWGGLRLGKPTPPTPPQSPDVIISFHNNDPEAPLVVEVIAPLNGILRVNPTIRKAARGASEALREEVEKAATLVKSLRQRENTLIRLMRVVVKEQRHFILYGEEHLKPMTRAQIAQMLGVSESTVSRAVAGKLVQLPSRKIVPLARFFESNLPVRAALRKIISQEKRPYSDAELVKRLREMGYHVARRTVAKYRALENIPSAYERRRQKQMAGSRL